MNLVTDTFPALAIGMESAPADIMHRKPRDAKQSFFAEGMAANLVFYGVVMSILTLGAYFLGTTLYGDPLIGETMAFLTLGLVQLFHVYNVRSSQRSIANGFFTNKWIHISFIVSAFLQTAIVLIVPLNAFFDVVPLSGTQWLYTALIAFAIIPISELVKAGKRLLGKGTRND